MATKRAVRDPFAMSGLDDDCLDAVERHNEQMIDALGDKTQRLLELTHTVHRSLRDDRRQLDPLDMSMDTSPVVVANGRALVAGIVDDPTYFGVGKIAICVFILLCVILMLLKFVLRPISRK
jgi:hypothetical protein